MTKFNILVCSYKTIFNMFSSLKNNGRTEDYHKEPIILKLRNDEFCSLDCNYIRKYKGSSDTLEFSCGLFLGHLSTRLSKHNLPHRKEECMEFADIMST